MKECPVCKAMSFNDAEVCFSCMHRFEKKQAPLEERVPEVPAPPVVSSPAAQAVSPTVSTPGSQAAPIAGSAPQTQMVSSANNAAGVHSANNASGVQVPMEDPFENEPFANSSFGDSTMTASVSKQPTPDEGPAVTLSRAESFARSKRPAVSRSEMQDRFTFGKRVAHDVPRESVQQNRPLQEIRVPLTPSTDQYQLVIRMETVVPR